VAQTREKIPPLVGSQCPGRSSIKSYAKSSVTPGRRRGAGGEREVKFSQDKAEELIGEKTTLAG